MQFHPGSILKMLRDVRGQSISLRRRLTAYLIALVCVMVALVFFVFNLIGIVNPIDRQIEKALSHQLDMSTSYIQHDIEEMAAWGLSFSERISDVVDQTLRARRIPFDGLRNNADALNEIQHEAYDAVYTHMKLTTCSGAFYFLNTTINDSLPETYYNGLYLKYANLYAESTIHNKPCMFRGSFEVARENGVNLYSTWQLETAAGTFDQAEALLEADIESPARGYLLTRVYSLPDSWEQVRLLCVPILLGGRTIGVCGFEISDIYFQLVYPADNAEQDQLACALLTEADGLWTGQMSGNRSGYVAPARAQFSIAPRNRYIVLDNGTDRFIGLDREITVGNSAHRIVAMIPQRLYDDTVRGGQIKAAAFMLVLMLLSIGVCVFLSDHYVKPILQGLSQLKSAEAERQPSNILEIDDLFEFLDARDRAHEAELTRLHMENRDVQRKRERAETALSHLHAAGIQEVDPEAYALFCSSLCTLTPREREVFDLYLQGKTGKDIQSLLNINQNTLKYHNRNIYDKLGVSSRKELLKYAALMEKDAEKSVP